MTGLRFGCVARRPAESRRAWLDRVRAVDRWGYDVLLLPDHLGVWPPFTPLVAAAEASDRLRFGTHVLNVGFWNPALLAREAAAVDVLTDGRLELGFGAGHAEDEFRAVGIPYPPSGERVDRLVEAVPLVRRLLAGEEVTADGRYRLDRCTTALTTTQQPVPVMVGGNGDGVLAFAARHADTVGFVGFVHRFGSPHPDLTHFGWDGVADRVEWVRRAAPGRVGELELSVLVQAVVLTDDRTGAGEELTRSFGQPPAVVLDSPFVMVGSVDGVADHVRRLRDELGVGYVTVFEPYAEPFSRVIEHLR